MVIGKKKSRAFGKDVYLLGEDADGVKYWLESPSWDCGWYWGFGYVETYTHNARPDLARDITSHQHVDGLLGMQDKGEYVHNLYRSPLFANTTFTEAEGWQLSELFAQFYLLKRMAEFAHKENPGCGVTQSPVAHGNLRDLEGRINGDMIPKVTGAILGILSCKKEMEK